MTVADELDLVIAHPAALKSGGRPGEIEHPHAVEPRIEQLLDLRLPGFAIGVPGAQRMGVVQTQRLDIGGDQADFLARRDRFAQRGNIAAREDVLARECVGAAGAAHSPDRVEQHDTVVRLHGGAGTEERFELRPTDMFEHSDRHNSIKFPILIPVITHKKFHSFC